MIQWEQPEVIHQDKTSRQQPHPVNVKSATTPPLFFLSRVIILPTALSPILPSL